MLLHHSTIPSSGTALDGGWQRYWREQSRRDGTDWDALCWQHIGTLYAVRRLCEASS